MMRIHYFRKLRRKSDCGFTLAELLIALVLLGLIATFTIPKILQSQQDSRKKAVFKETIATLSALTAEGVRTGELCQNPRAYFESHLNAIKVCKTNVITQGCWPVAGMTCGAADFGQATGFVLANGAMLSDFDISSACSGGTTEGVSIDWNGLLPPNTEGDDQLGIRLVYELNGGVQAGRVTSNSLCAASATYFDNELWK